MEAKPYDDLPEEMSQKIADAFQVRQTAEVAKRVIYERLKELAITGELERLSEEECQLLAEFRRFKATTKAGGVFKWQTRPDGRLISEPPDNGLIVHPQNVSEPDMVPIG